MRIWVVDPRILDNNRVLGAHNEIHMAIGLIKESLERGRVHSLVKRWYTPEGFAAIVKYHSLIVREMEKRGWGGHQTDLSFPEELSEELEEGKRTVAYVDDFWPPTL